MYEWMTVMFFVYLGPTSQPAFIPYQNAEQACISDHKRVWAIQAQEIPVAFGKDTDGKTLVRRSGEFRFRVRKVKCSGKLDWSVVEPDAQ